MPTPNLNNPQVQQKVANALRYGSMVKEKILEHNTLARTLIDGYIRKINAAIQKGEAYTQHIEALLFDLGFMLNDVLTDSIRLAIDKEGENLAIEALMDSIPLAVDKCSLSYYQTTIEKYGRILSNEIIFAIENGYLDDLTLFLSNPQGYIADKKDGLQRLKSSIDDAGRGVSYSFAENINKLVASAAALAFTNAQMYLWGRKSNIIGYIGVRNSNYPCPLCDSYAYQFIPMSQGMIYPLHNRCVCTVIPLTESELL